MDKDQSPSNPAPRVTVKPPKPFNVQEIRKQMLLHPERLVPMEWLDAGFTCAEWEALPESPCESGDMIAGHVMPPDQAVTHPRPDVHLIGASPTCRLAQFAPEVEAGAGGTLEPITGGSVPDSADQPTSHLTPGVATAVAAVPGEETKRPSRRLRSSGSVYSSDAARKMEAYIETNGGQAKFAETVGATPRTLLSFRKTGRVRRDIFDAIAGAMGITREEFLKPE